MGTAMYCRIISSLNSGSLLGVFGVLGHAFKTGASYVEDGGVGARVIVNEAARVNGRLIL